VRYRVYDEEDKKERILDDCTTPMEVGTTRRVTIKKGNKRETHHFRVLEVLPEAK
jgi:hypothetical protein